MRPLVLLQPTFVAFTDTFLVSGSVIVPNGAAQLVFELWGQGGPGGTGIVSARAAAGGGGGAHGSKTIALGSADWGTIINFTLDGTSARCTLALVNFSGTLTAGSGGTGGTGSGSATGGAAGVASGSWGSSTNGSQGGNAANNNTGGTGGNGASGATGGAGGLNAGNVPGNQGGTPDAGGGGGPYDLGDSLNGIPGGGQSGQARFAWT